MFKKIITSYLLLTGILFLSQCSTAPDPSPPLQTRILQVKVEPNPVAMGDTATFTCVFADSLDKRFSFRWRFEGVVDDTVTKENKIDWIAPNNPKEYFNLVTAFNSTNSDSVPDKQIFTVEVVTNQE